MALETGGVESGESAPPQILPRSSTHDPVKFAKPFEELITQVHVEGVTSGASCVMLRRISLALGRDGTETTSRWRANEYVPPG